MWNERNQVGMDIEKQVVGADAACDVVTEGLEMTGMEEGHESFGKAGGFSVAGNVSGELDQDDADARIDQCHSDIKRYVELAMNSPLMHLDSALALCASASVMIGSTRCAIERRFNRHCSGSPEASPETDLGDDSELIRRLNVIEGVNGMVIDLINVVGGISVMLSARSKAGGKIDTRDTIELTELIEAWAVAKNHTEKMRESGVHKEMQDSINRRTGTGGEQDR
jgi:hypothetical protein